MLKHFMIFTGRRKLQAVQKILCCSDNSDLTANDTAISSTIL